MEIFAVVAPFNVQQGGVHVGELVGIRGDPLGHVAIATGEMHLKGDVVPQESDGIQVAVTSGLELDGLVVPFAARGAFGIRLEAIDGVDSLVHASVVHGMGDK